MLDLPFNICENQYFSKEELPPTFGTYFDGWTHNGEHFTCIFATWTNKSGGVVFRLLSCGVQDIPDEDDVVEVGFSVADYGDYFYDVLARFGRDYHSLEFTGGDNCGVNTKFADLITAWLKIKVMTENCLIKDVRLIVLISE